MLEDKDRIFTNGLHDGRPGAVRKPRFAPEGRYTRILLSFFISWFLSIGFLSSPAAIANEIEFSENCATSEHRAFDFWIGEWNAFLTDTEEFIGYARIDLEDRGCVLFEYWELANGSRTGRSLNIYDNVTGQWEQFWADSAGDRTHYVGDVFGDGIRMTAKGDVTPGRPEPFNNRITFTPNADGSVRQVGDISTDGGEWTQQYDITFKRAENGRDMIDRALSE